MAAGEAEAGVARLQAWLREAAWPFWLAHGVDRARGGFFEALDLRSHACTAPFRRLRVAARQVFVFAEAHRAGLAGADEAVHLGIAFLHRNAAHPEGGFNWRFDLQHRPVDTTRDLYDHAFVLLAFSAASAVLGVDAMRPHAVALLAWLDGALPHPQGGYGESLPAALPRRQNPHMHLLEALLAAHEAFGDQVFAARADALLELFETRLFDGEAGALPEYFDDALRPERQAGRAFLVEPGHHCEWVWLLDRARRLGFSGAWQSHAGRLMAFVDRHGLDPERGGLVDEVDSLGRVVGAGSRLWPQAERLKAEFLRLVPSPMRQAQAVDVLEAYLRPEGLWHERRDPLGALSSEPAPATSLYHLTSAITTVARHLAEASRPAP